MSFVPRTAAILQFLDPDDIVKLLEDVRQWLCKNIRVRVHVLFVLIGI